jgi:hypothetical protein
MSAEIDKGPIIVQRKLELEPCEHSINSTLYALADSATELFRENWIDIAEGTFALKTTDALGSRHSLKGRAIRDAAAPSKGYRGLKGPIAFCTSNSCNKVIAL